MGQKKLSVWRGQPVRGGVISYDTEDGRKNGEQGGFMIVNVSRTNLWV